MTGMRVGLSGLESVPSVSERARLQRHFTRTGCVKLSKFLAPSLLKLLRDRIKGAAYELRQRGSGPEQVMVTDWAQDLLVFLVNQPACVRSFEDISGSERLGAAIRRKIYRLGGKRGYRKDWHDDAEPGWQLVVAVNLSARPCRGGLLQTRGSGARRVLATLRTLPGDAVLISTSPRFQHRVTTVSGRTERVSFTTAFESGASYLRRVRPQGTRKHVPLHRGLASWRHGHKVVFFTPTGHLAEVDDARGSIRTLRLPTP